MSQVLMTCQITSNSGDAIISGVGEGNRFRVMDSVIRVVFDGSVKTRVSCWLHGPNPVLGLRLTHSRR